jgi:hypothetical protein
MRSEPTDLLTHLVRGRTRGKFIGLAGGVASPGVPSRNTIIIFPPRHYVEINGHRCAFPCPSGAMREWSHATLGYPVTFGDATASGTALAFLISGPYSFHDTWR